MEAMRRKQDEAQLSAFTATVDAFEAQLYGPTKKTAERPNAKAAERAAKEPAKGAARRSTLSSANCTGNEGPQSERDGVHG